MPRLNLPDPPDEKLLNSPIALVVWQLRFSALPEITLTDNALSVHDRLGGRKGDLPHVNQFEANELNVQASSSGTAPPIVNQHRQPAWQFISKDRATTITLANESLAVETTNYDRWVDGFAVTVRRAIEAVASVAAPVEETRVGLRYIDRIGGLGVQNFSEWNEWIKPWALGASADSGLAEGLVISESGSVFEVSEDVDAKSRIALLGEDDDNIAVIDIDVSRGDRIGARDFDLESILNVSEDLHTVAKQVFIACIQEKLYEHLKGE